MRRMASAAALLGVLVAGLGCKHVGGMCDCFHDPANAEINTGGNGIAYPTIGQPVPSPNAPEKMAPPAAK